MERRTFTREFKLEAVKLIEERGVTVAQAARDLGVQGSVLRRWVQECAADSQQAFPGQGQMKPEQAELARLRREVIKLTAERDILKKAAGSSTDQCNTRRSFFRLGFISQDLSGPLIQFAQSCSARFANGQRDPCPSGNTAEGSLLVFSFVPRCQGLRGSQKYTWVSVARVKVLWSASSMPRSQVND